MRKRYRNYVMNIIFPSCVFGAVTGMLTAAVVTLYKLCANIVIGYSEQGYELLRRDPSLLLPVLSALLIVALLLSIVYKKAPYLGGGGIPTSIGALRGITGLRWFLNTVGVFILSLISFLIGVPLGNEGPSVQMGTSVGKGSLRIFTRKRTAWERYSMTGGACAGFAVATGAPISGILFSIEEAHQRISPMIITVSSVSVIFSYLTSSLLSPIFGVSTTLFPSMNISAISVTQIWIPLLSGVAVGLFSVIFLIIYKCLNHFFSDILCKIPLFMKIFPVFVLTVVFGFISNDYISTGHHLMLHVFERGEPILLLVMILAVRSVLTVSANSNRLTGGIFLPMLTLGVLAAAIVSQILTDAFGLPAEYRTAILVFGITACISGMMKMPLTAILFAVEALSCHANILHVIVASASAYLITELFETKSITDAVLEQRIEAISHGAEQVTYEAELNVKRKSFAVGKQIRDILWPANLFVLSVKRTAAEEVDQHGGIHLCKGDVLHVRITTHDLPHTAAELDSILGEQNIPTEQWKVIGSS